MGSIELSSALCARSALIQLDRLDGRGRFGAPWSDSYRARHRRAWRPAQRKRVCWRRWHRYKMGVGRFGRA